MKALYPFVRPGLVAIKRFWKPFLLIEVCGLVLVIAYFKSASVKSVADEIGRWKDAGGVPFAMVACAIASAVIPELAKMLALGDTHWNRKRWNNLVFNLGLFSIMGLIAIYFYAFLEWLWPDDGRTVTALKKMAMDQFLYSPFITLVVVSLGFTWREVRWSIPALLRQLGPTWYLRRIGVLIVPCWCFWIPMTTLMYSLPYSLVFVFSMTAQAAWALVMLFVAAHPAPVAASPAHSPEVV